VKPKATPVDESAEEPIDQDLVPTEPYPDADLAISLSDTAEDAETAAAEDYTPEEGEDNLSLALEHVGRMVDDLAENASHDRRRLLRHEAQVTDALDEITAMFDTLNERIERIEEHVGLKPSLLSAVERAVSELDEAAQAGALNPRAVARLHRRLRAAVEEERQKKIQGA
jgi:hypothetical protein